MILDHHGTNRLGSNAVLSKTRVLEIRKMNEWICRRQPGVVQKGVYSTIKGNRKLAPESACLMG
jgi:hypothetical protein